MYRVVGTATVLAAALLLGSAGGRAQEVVDIPVETREEGRLHRQQTYFGLWPFFSREVYEDGSGKWTSLAGLIRSETQQDGDWHHHVLPFYCASLWEGGTDRELALFPLLYLGRTRPQGSHDVVLPLFYRWQAGEARHLLLWPLFHMAASPEPEPFRWVPTLFRHGDQPDGSSRTRLGFAPVLELYERATDPTQSAWTFLNLFNFDYETRSGLPLAKYRRSGPDDYHTHLFPLYFTGRSGEEQSYFHTPLVGWWRGADGRRGLSIPPLLAWGSRSETEYDVHALALFHFWDEAGGWGDIAVPFYWAGGDRGGESSRCYSLAYWRLEDEARKRTTHIVPLLLAAYGYDESSYALDVLWPLIHRSREAEDRHALRLLPFYDARRNTEGSSLGVGGILYRRHETFAAETVSHWIFLPLGHWKRSPEGLVAWGIPVFYRGRETTPGFDRSTLFIAPSFFSRTSTVTWTSTSSGSSTTESIRYLHLWPLYGNRQQDTVVQSPDTEPLATVQERSFSTLYPFFEIEHALGGPFGGRDETTTVHVPWPLCRWRSSRQWYDLYLFPPLYVGSHESRSYFYLYPALSVETGSEAHDGFWHWTSLFHWYDREDHYRFNVFPLLFCYEKDSDSLAITGPLWLWRYRASPADGWFHLLPLGFGKWSEDESALGVFPFFYQHDRGGGAVRPFSAWRYFFLVNHLRSDVEEDWSFLWKVYHWHAEADGDSETRVLHRLYLRRHVEGQHELVINPFLDWSHDEQTGDRAFHILKVLYRDDTHGGERTVRLLGIPVWRDQAPATAPAAPPTAPGPLSSPAATRSATPPG